VAELFDGKNIFDLLLRLKALNNIGAALSSEKNSTRLLERILEEAKSLTFSDGGALYTITDDGKLKFEIMLVDTLGIHIGGTSGHSVPFPPIPLYDSEGEPNSHIVTVYVALYGVTVNTPDADRCEKFDFFGTREFDTQTGYRSKSFLTVPMKNNEGEVIGVLQLLNALDPSTGEFGAFGQFEQELVESLTSQAAVALVNQQLLEGERHLFESFIELIATAIDDKSPYTGGHCHRVAELTLMLADAASQTTLGPLKSFYMTEEDRYELSVAGWLHDCGKITTPEYIIDKSTKLETIFDRIELLDTRFEVLKAQAENAMLRQKLALKRRNRKKEAILEAELAKELKVLDEERRFLHQCNLGSEWMSEDAKQRVHKIAQRRWITPQGTEENFLSENEVYNLTISKGTLTSEEREIINYHIVATINMLKSLPYPKYLEHVPEYAGGHHERMDGKGYPSGLTREQMSIPARIMGIADIFEALTAKDRPYKKGMLLSQALKILGKMKEEHHIDPDLFDVFIHEKVYLKYATKFMDPDQIDEFDVSQLPGYRKAE
jgi:HD-GYP domain-containing protein (c-di-GMP phosphodiesterase class II)